MKRIALLALAFCLILVAGCSTAPTVSPETPGPSVPPVSYAQPSVLKSGNYSLISSIDHFEVDARGSGKYIVNIYYRVTNTGTESNRLILYSNLTDKSGLFHGGLGVSHGGSGAQTFILDPNTTGIMRDYVTIDTERDYSLLKKGGAILDVVYADQKAPLDPIANLTSRWTLPPSIFS
ncbi:hypothetical protein [Methanoregula sp.]|uniref:hypothetical protein n=1 Tax=Methanoregula sp. TaxID=2052170 RepID=UPI00356359B7